MRYISWALLLAGLQFCAACLHQAAQRGWKWQPPCFPQSNGCLWREGLSAVDHSARAGSCPGVLGLLWMGEHPNALLGCCLGISLSDSLCFLLSWILCFLKPPFSYFWLVSLGRGTFSSFLIKGGRKVNFLRPTRLKMPLLNHHTWLIVDWVENSRLEIIFRHNFRHCLIEYLIPCESFVWNLETCFFFFCFYSGSFSSLLFWNSQSGVLCGSVFLHCVCA